MLLEIHKLREKCSYLSGRVIMVYWEHGMTTTRGTRMVLFTEHPLIVFWCNPVFCFQMRVAF